MRELERRLERLEHLHQAHDELPTVFVRFSDADPAAISYFGTLGSETLSRDEGESMAAFEKRAIAHFEPKRPPRCGLVLLFLD